MAKKQTRRSISVSHQTYERAKEFADTKGVSLSELTELALRHAVEHFYRNAASCTGTLVHDEFTRCPVHD